MISVELRAFQSQQFVGSKIRKETYEDRGAERHVAPKHCLHGHGQEATSGSGGARDGGSALRQTPIKRQDPRSFTVCLR